MTETAPAPPFLMGLSRVKSIRACHPAPRLRAVRSGLTICHWQIVRAALTPLAGAFAPARSGAAGFTGVRRADGPLPTRLRALAPARRTFHRKVR